MIARAIRPTDRVGIAFRIHELRMDLEETQIEFGQRFNVERLAVYRWEHRINIPSLTILKEMARQLDTTVGWILYGSDKYE